jgi:signal transduction histidine kinase
LFVIRDISDQKRAEEALRQQEAFIRSVLDNLPMGVAVSSSDATQAQTYMNELFPRIYQTTREALEGVAADPDAFWEKAYEDPAVRESIKAQVLKDIGSGDPSRMHWERIPITREGKETTFIDARNIPVPGTSTMISTVWDVTEQIHREEETLRLEAQLNEAQKMESLGLLAGGVAHDINNVLAAVLAVATIHRRKAPEGTPLHQDMETITQACLRGGSLAKSLLGFARKDLREERWLNLNDLIREVANRLKHTTLENITLQTDLSDNLREVKGDPTSLNHALMNLCVNAFEAMPGGGTLTVRTRNEGPNGILVEVEDSGIGMTQEVLSQALVPFYTTKQSSKGTGLGLSLVYGTVKSHRGTMDIQSPLGRGTLVRLWFPAPDAAQAERPGNQISESEGASAKKSILFVDDDPLLLQSMPRLLEHLGHRATAVASGEQALALIDQGFRPDLVILDVNMPGIGGLETLLQLRKRDPALPALLSSGFASQPILELLQNHPGVHMIVKPYSLEELKREIREVAP